LLRLRRLNASAPSWFQGRRSSAPSAARQFEREMFERTSAAGRMSAHIQEILMSPDASQKMLAFFQPG
jgi:hypothetical protein